jgi:hypothetical protein
MIVVQVLKSLLKLFGKENSAAASTALVEAKRWNLYKLTH